MTPANPYRTTLKYLAIIGLVLGALLLLISAGIYNTAVTQLAETGTLPDPAAWGGLSVFGSWVFGLGVAALLLWLVVSSIGWDGSLEPVKKENPASRTLEDIRADLAEKSE